MAQAAENSTRVYDASSELSECRTSLPTCFGVILDKVGFNET